MARLYPLIGQTTFCDNDENGRSGGPTGGREAPQPGSQRDPGGRRGGPQGRQPELGAHASSALTAVGSGSEMLVRVLGVATDAASFDHSR